MVNSPDRVSVSRRIVIAATAIPTVLGLTSGAALEATGVIDVTPLGRDNGALVKGKGEVTTPPTNFRPFDVIAGRPIIPTNLGKDDEVKNPPAKEVNSIKKSRGNFRPFDVIAGRPIIPTNLGRGKK